MSGEEPAADFVEELLHKADKLVPVLLKQLEEAAGNGGQKVRRYKCENCGRGGTVSIEVVDVEQARKLVETLASLKMRLAAAQRDEQPAAVARILSDFSSLTNAELAEHIASLEAEVERSTTPARKELGALLDRLDEDGLQSVLEHARTVGDG